MPHLLKCHTDNMHVICYLEVRGMQWHIKKGRQERRWSWFGKKISSKEHKLFLRCSHSSNQKEYNINFCVLLLFSFNDDCVMFCHCWKWSNCMSCGKQHWRRESVFQPDLAGIEYIKEALISVKSLIKGRRSCVQCFPRKKMFFNDAQSWADFRRVQHIRRAGIGQGDVTSVRCKVCWAAPV